MNKLTNEEIGSTVSSEGIGYAIEYQINSNEIEDNELKKWWKQAEEAIDKINELLEDYIEEM